MHLGWPFLPWLEGWAEHPLWHSTQSDDLYWDAQVHAQTFPPKTDYDIIGTSYGNIMMTLGIYSDDIYVSIEGYKRTNARWGGDSKLDFTKNRSSPPRYLGTSQHQACQEFIQTEKSGVMLLLHWGCEPFSNQSSVFLQFLSLSDFQGSLPRSKEWTTNNKDLWDFWFWQIMWTLVGEFPTPFHVPWHIDTNTIGWSGVMRST